MTKSNLSDDDRTRFHNLIEEYLRDTAQIRDENEQLRRDNASHIAEIEMLRAELDRCDADRMRLHATAAAFMTNLNAARSAIEAIAREAIKQNVQAAAANQSASEKQVNHDSQDAELRDLVQRLPRMN